MSSRPDFTPQQAAAIFTQGVSIALSAGAGCGKTFVLTERFLTGLEPQSAGGSGADLHSLVAITFTERAAREMRDRIRASCHQRLQNCESHEVDHWLGILRGLDSARISTIHSFCTSLLRSQAVEAGLDPRFAVLEAALADTLLRHTVRETLHGMVEAEEDDAIQFVVQFGLERARELLRKLTAQRFQIDFSKFEDITPEELAADWRRRWKSEFVPKLVAKFRESPLVTRVLDAIADSPSKNETMRERIANLGAILPPRTPWRDAFQALDEIHENARVLGGGGKKDWVSEDRQEQCRSSLDKLRKSINDLRNLLNYRDEDVDAAAALACRGLRLTERIAASYAVAKRAQGVLDFDDLLLHARNLLRDNEHVRQRVANGIRLLMVDEFQDTDPVQADVVRSLCGAALTRGKLFMVGDRKQSIYRFRRADPTVFTTMSDELPPSGRLPLNVNFRSQPAVLSFVNHLFAPAMDGYESLMPFHNEQLSPTPVVEFLLATFDADGADVTGSDTSQRRKRAPVAPADDDVRPNAAELRAREADWISRRISSLLKDETPRIRTKSKDANGRTVLRRTEPGDIVILFRALSSVQEYEAALRRYGLDYYLVGGKAFFAQQEVFDLLNLCRYLDDCDDLIGLVGILRSPFFNLSDDAIQALAFHTESAASSGPTSAPSDHTDSVPPPRGLLKKVASEAVAQPAALRQQSSKLTTRSKPKVDPRQKSLFDDDEDQNESDALSNDLESAIAPPSTSPMTTGINSPSSSFIVPSSSVPAPPAPASRATLSLHQTLYLDPPNELPEDQRSRIRFAAEILSDLRAIKDRIPLPELLTRAIERTGYDASLLTEFLGRRKLANLRKLVEMARQFEQGDFFTLKDFVTRLQTSVLEETDEEFATTLPESGDVIRLMSIHQSKGLEGPGVIVADIDRKGPPRGADAVLHPELGPLIKPPEKFGDRAENLALRMHNLAEEEADAEETIRLFYVACTRAADYLILSTGQDGDKAAHSPWLELVESRFDVRTGLLKVDPLLGSSTGGTAGRETIPDILVHLVPSEAKLAEDSHEKRISPGDLPGRVLAASPGEFPPSARIFARDVTDLSMISVSRLEAIDAELTGLQHASRTRTALPWDKPLACPSPGNPAVSFSDKPEAYPTLRPANLDDEPIDLDMATTLGTIVHAVLERVDFQNSSSWPELLTTAASQSRENLGPAVIQHAHTMLERFFASSVAEELANAKSIHREIDFLLPWPVHQGNSPESNFPSPRPAPMIAGIIDLLVETDQGFLVLDYKTGEFPLGTPDEQLLAPYALQLGLYAHAVEQWFGDMPKELSLITFKPQVRRVTLPWSEKRWENIQGRVTRAIESIRNVAD